MAWAEKQKGRRGRMILGGLALVFILAGLYFALIQAPPDAYQGEVQRIMYLHIPSILTAYLSFFIVFVGSSLFLWKREKRDDILAYAGAERSEEHTSELQSRGHLVCRLLL